MVVMKQFETLDVRWADKCRRTCHICMEDGTRVKMMTSAAGRAADHVSMDMFSENISMLT